MAPDAALAFDFRRWISARSLAAFSTHPVARRFLATLARFALVRPVFFKVYLVLLLRSHNS
jgi:hypothetical protein